jgi:hypothetical protein
MMQRLPQTFTPDELDLLAIAVGAYVGEWEGAAPDDAPSPVKTLSEKIERLRRIGRTFTFRDGDFGVRTGTVVDYVDWEGILLVELRIQGQAFLRRVGEGALIQEV